MAFMRWIQQLKDRLRPLLEGVAGMEAMAAHGAARTSGKGMATRLNFPSAPTKPMPAAAAAPSPANITALPRPRGGADALLLQQQQSSVLAAAALAASRRRSKQAAASAASSAKPSHAPRHHQQQQQQQQAQTESSSFAAAGPRSIPVSEGGNGNAAGSTSSSKPEQQQQQQQQRFKRCYYVPVMNPLPDLKEKQLAVLDMRLFGIRDMPALRERPPALPPSVLNTARLRGLPLFQTKDVVEALEASFLQHAMAMDGPAGQQQPQQPPLTMAAAVEGVMGEDGEGDGDEEEAQEEGGRLRADSKGY